MKSSSCYQSSKEVEFAFLLSALFCGDSNSITDVLDWIRLKNNEVKSNIRLIPLSEMNAWICDDVNIRHISGKFFSVDGIRVKTNWGIIPIWEQPIINQPEIGFLGMVTKKINGILHFLVQAKIEPGNINIVQISPTLQATRSNYSCVHNGNAPLYLEYFNGNKPVNILIDQLQSEQGARFLRKRNRNIIVELDKDENIVVYENFIWLSLGQIKRLLNFENLVNMDTRTVISCINYGSYSQENLAIFHAINDTKSKLNEISTSYLDSLLSKSGQLNSNQDILNWLTNLKFSTDLEITKVPLSKVSDWRYDKNTMTHKKDKFFSVIGVRVEIENREVQSWDQPMIKPAQEGIIAFVTKKINGIYHFLIQAKLESGNFDLIELAPTVQCLTGNYRQGENEYTIPYLKKVLEASKEDIWYSSYQSEEGGRFFREQNLNMIVEVDETFPVGVESNYCWMTLNQLSSFVLYNNYLNIAARSLLAAIKFDNK